MAKQSKFIKLNPNVLMEWIFDNEEYVTENYKVITNLNENKKRNFLSTTNLNNVNNNLFQLDSVLKKYTAINPAKYNFLQEQNYSSVPTQYDTVRIYLPTSYNFVYSGYVGLYLKIFTYGYYNNVVYELSNIFFDATSTSNSGLTNLAIPFIYDEQNWGKYYEFKIPSIDYISNQRIISNTGNTVINNTINDNLTLGEGLSQTSPIFIDFQYLNSKEITLGTTYYYASESFRTSFPKTPEFNTLAVTIQESTEGDFFEIFGTYGGFNENVDNFIREMENKGRSIRLEFDIYLYEENIQTNKQTVIVTDDFTKKILYRPILTFTNTTAAIKVEMRIIDLVDMSTVSRFSTIGLDGNVQKYGKKLISLNVQNLNKLKIYNAKPDEIILGKDYFSGNLTSEIIKVNSPQLIEVGKIIVNSPTSTNEYKGMGLLNIVVTPFDNIIQFRLAQIPSTSSGSANAFEKYDLSTILNNSEIILTFKSDTESIDKPIYKETDNDYKNGIINFKIVENDIATLKKIYSKGYTNFYLTILSNKVKTLLYSGTFSFYEDITFTNNSNSTVSITETSIVETPTSTEQTAVQTTAESEWPKAGRTVIIYTKYKNTTN
ncbi:hypothetical protein M0Q97_03685 [Candidatus Dojkabacteria bacterium]|jgi:hypothetical protein|nr:hypothetical protein [Candidatus Dojkabacteria bacterium]